MQQSAIGRYRLPFVGEVSRWLAAGPALFAGLSAVVSLIVLTALLVAPGSSDSTPVRAAGGFLVAIVFLLTVPVAVAFLDAGFALLRSHLRIGTWLRVTALAAVSSLSTIAVCVGLAWDIRPWSFLVVLFVAAVDLWVLVVGWTLVLCERRRSMRTV